MPVTIVQELPPETKPAPPEICPRIPVTSMTFQDGSRFDLFWNEAGERWEGALFTPGKERLTASAPGVLKVMNALVALDEARATAEPKADAPAPANDQGK